MWIKYADEVSRYLREHETPDEQQREKVDLVRKRVEESVKDENLRAYIMMVIIQQIHTYRDEKKEI